MEDLQTVGSVAENLVQPRVVNDSYPTYLDYVNAKRAEFAHFAPQYDLQTKVASLGRISRIRCEQADLAVGETGGKALELCCGTGGLTVELAQRFERVLGIDLCPEMLGYAKKRLEKRGINNVELRECEVSKLQFPDNTFASISISLGLHELPNWIKEPLLSKSVKWLKPGGRFVVCDYRKLDNRLGAFLFRTFARTFIEPRLYDEHMAFDLYGRMSALGLERVAVNRSFLSFFEMCAWSPVSKSGKNR